MILSATLCRPVAHDCADTIPVPVQCNLPDHRLPGFDDYDAVVTEDVVSEEGVRLFEQDEVIRWQNFTQEDVDTLEEAYRRLIAERIETTQFRQAEYFDQRRVA